MSVAIAAPQAGTFWQRLTGTEPKTVVRETSTTTITSEPGGHFNVGTAVRNGAIGAAVAGALGGVSLLAKVALPLVGRIGSVAGLAKFAGLGGALGLATAALPVVLPAVRNNPTAKAAVTGAAIGAAAGAVLPLLPIPVGAAIGAAAGLLIHHRRTHPAPVYTQYPGYEAHPGYVPAYPGGMGYGADAGMYPQMQGFPSGAGGVFCPPTAPPLSLPMQAQQAAAPQAQAQRSTQPQVATVPTLTGLGTVAPTAVSPAGVAPGAAPTSFVPSAATPAAAAAPAPAAVPTAVSTPVAEAPPAPVSAGAPKYVAKTFTDGSGNLRQVGTGRIIKAAGTTQPTTHTVRPA